MQPLVIFGRIQSSAVILLLLTGISLFSCTNNGGNGWGAPVVLGPGFGFLGSIPQVTVDDTGNAVAVWDYGSQVLASRYDVNAGWGAPEQIEVDSIGAFPPQICLLSTGEVLVVWAQQALGFRISLWANRYVPGVGWDTATLLETDDTGDVMTLPHIGCAGNSAIAVWSQYDGTRYSAWANRYVAGTGWETAAMIDPNNTGMADFPSVGVDSNGNALAVWEESSGIWTNRYTSGVGWGTEVSLDTLSGSPGMPDIAIDQNGDGIALWTNGSPGQNSIKTNRYVNGIGWGTTESIPNTVDAIVPRLDTDNNNNATAVWLQFDGSWYRVHTRRYLAGTGWEIDGMTLSKEAGNILSAPGVTVNTGGDALVAWGWEVNPSAGAVFVARYRAENGWGSLKLATMAYSPDVDLNESGQGVAVWSEWDGVQYQIMASQSE